LPFAFVERYDEASESWILGPSLTTARSIVSVVVVNNRLYAIGGFSGKKFLNTIEYFDAEANEWTKFAKLQQPIVEANYEEDFPSLQPSSKVQTPTKVKAANGTTSYKDKLSEDESVIMPPVC